MISKLLTYEKHRMPEALTLEHEDLYADLIRATTVPGRIGEAAGRVARLCRAHFAQEEDNLFRAFGLLSDLASDRARLDIAAVTRIVAQFSARDGASRGDHKSIDAALESLFQAARDDENKEIAEFVGRLKNHEKIENEVMYPTVLQIAGSVQQGLAI